MTTPQGPASAGSFFSTLCAAQSEGYVWAQHEPVHHALRRRGLPHQVLKGAGTFNPAADSIKVMTLHVSKGLEFPVVAMVGVGHMPAQGEDERDEARLFYVGGYAGDAAVDIGGGG